MKSCIDCTQPETESIPAEIAKAIRPQIWKDRLLILFFMLTVSVLTFGLK